MALDLLGRIRRTIICKRRYWNLRKLEETDPKEFYKNPNKYERMVYASFYGVYPDLKHPKDINQQLMALNIEALSDNKQRALRIMGADKYRVREYVEKKGFKEILVPLYGVYDRFEDIDFLELPSQFVVKSNFGCGHNLICKNKSELDIPFWTKKFSEWMAIEDFGLKTGEWHYGQIEKKIVVEKYIDSLGAISINDYKFHCFNGKVYGCFVGYDRVPNVKHDVQFDHYDKDWRLTDGILDSFHPRQRIIEKPTGYDEMVKIAEKLTEGIPYCRVDLYEDKGHILFGEMTFTPAGNMMDYYKQWVLEDMLRFYYATK